MKPTTKTVSIDDLVLNSNNPRLIKDEKFKKLVNSIKEFPEMLNLRPIVVNDEMVILGGNMRFRACIEAGLKEVPVTIAKGLTQEQEAEFIIKDNASFGDWDWDTLANEWNNTQLTEWGLDVWHNNSDVDLNQFFEDKGDTEKGQAFKVVLEFNEKDYADVTELFKKHTGTKESIVLKLLQG